MKEKLIGLDLLRSIAIILVLIWHWIPENNSINFLFNGKLGVNIFFVLSGYLISKSLLLSTKNGLFDQLIQFYYRRFMRIFPIYYLVLIILILIDYSSIREVQGWYWLYGVNILNESTKDVVPYTIHFWSLSVEEQFYLVWPILFLFFVKIKGKIFSFFMVLIFASIAFHLFDSLIIKIPWLNVLVYIFSFALGSLLLFFQDKIRKKSAEKLVLLALFLSILVSFGVRNEIISSRLNIFSLDLIFSFLSFTLLAYVLKIENLLANKSDLLTPFIFIGKISYGIYIYHYFAYPFNNFMHRLSEKNNWCLPFTDFILFPEFSNVYVRFFYFSFLTGIIATISYYLIEKRIIDFSRK